MSQGPWVNYWPSGQKKSEGTILDGEWQGAWKAWDKEGRLDAKLTGTYDAGVKKD